MFAQIVVLFKGKVVGKDSLFPAKTCVRRLQEFYAIEKSIDTLPMYITTENDVKHLERCLLLETA